MASYDLDLGTTNLDLMVISDANIFHPRGHLFFESVFQYHEGQLALLNRKITTADKRITEDRLRR